LVGTLSFRSEIAGLRSQLSRLQTENERIQKEHSAAQAQDARLQAPQSAGGGASEPITLALKDIGGNLVTDKEGDFRIIRPLPPATQQAVAMALRQQSMQFPPVVAEIAGKAGTLLGGGDEGVPFALSSPLSTVVISDRPIFRWQPLPGAVQYRVFVFDSDFKRVAASPTLVKPEWTAQPPLERGRVYTWQVEALKDGTEVLSPRPPAPEARFQVMEKPKVEELTRSVQAYSDSLLISAILYANAGALEEAERELKRLEELNPQSPVPHKLLQQIRSARGF